MRYPKPEDRYSCEVLCENFMEIEERLNELGSGTPGGTGGSGGDGKDGFSPIATVTETDEGAIIEIEDVNGKTSATIRHGENGSDASVTAQNITNALGYTPAKQTDVESIAQNIPLYIKWDGNTEGRETVSPFANNNPFYKVSDLTYSADELDGCYVEISEFEETCVADKSLFEETEDMIILKVNGLKADGGGVIATFGVVVKHDIDGATKGTYFVHSSDVYTEKLSKNMTDIIEEAKAYTDEAVANIDVSWNDLTDKPFVTPQMYGAKGDGVTDDSDAIQQAIDSGFPVKVPRGHYLLTKPIYIRGMNVSVTSVSENLEFNSDTQFIFDNCDGIVMEVGARFFKFDGVLLKANNPENENSAVICEAIDGERPSVHNIHMRNFYVVDFNIFLNDGVCTMWDCEFSHIRTQNVEYGLYLGQQTNNENFGVVFNNVYFDNSKLMVTHSKLTFIGCNIGIQQSDFAHFKNNCFINFMNCNFEMDSAEPTGRLMFFEGKEFIFTNCQFLLLGQGATMIKTNTDLSLMRFEGCIEVKKQADTTSVLLDGTTFGRNNGCIQIVGDGIKTPTPNNNWYNAMVLSSPSSILHGHDNNDSTYKPHAIRFSDNRQQIEYTSDGTNFVDVYGNPKASRGTFPFVLGNGFYIDGGEVAVTGDTVTVNYNHKVNGMVFVTAPPKVDNVPIMILRDESADYKDKPNYAVFRIMMWNATNARWDGNTKAFTLKWIKISL